MPAPRPASRPRTDAALDATAPPGAVSGGEVTGKVGGAPARPAPEVEVRRSARRRRTVSAYRSEGKIVVLLPARMSRAEEAEWVQRMVERLESDRRRVPGDRELERRAADLSRRFLEGRASPTSVRWSTRQQRRWGSCTTTTGAIRLSQRLAEFPSYVLDYVLVHELSHLLVPDHSSPFWAWVARYPDAERAKGFLEGVEHGAGWRPDESDLDEDAAAGDPPVVGDQPRGAAGPSPSEPSEASEPSEPSWPASLF